MPLTLNIPIFTERKNLEGSKKEYVAQPVFFSDFQRSDPREARAISRLAADVREHVSSRCADPDHYVPLAWSFSPELRCETVRLAINLKKSHCEVRYFIVRFKSFDRWICFCPKLIGVNFELHRGQVLADRAHEVYSEYFRKLERQEGRQFPEEYETEGTARLDYIEVINRRNQKLPKDDDFRYSSIGGSSSMSGNAELERVGRNLNRLYPDSLGGAILRDAEVQELSDAVTNTNRQRPVMLVGESQVGKTAIVHQFMRTQMEWGRAGKPPVEEEKRKKQKNIGGVWLLDPQRLISGMSFVGQWEERFLAIVKEVRKRRHVMYIDDIIGFFQSGRTRDSDLTLGDLLKAQHEESPINILAETTPEGWRKLREIDRGFADAFKVIRIKEPSEADTIRIAIQTMHELEDDCRVQFRPEVLPLTIDLQRRFMRSRAFPGKAAEFLRQLASNHPRQTIDANLAREHFQRKTGMATAFIDSGATLPRNQVDTFFRNRIVGQQPALDAMSDVISIGKGRLNDPTRPMASLLFLGPTGVGKTECAKALAEFVFGSADRMLRFDMNEFVGPDAAGRLIGFRGQPRGLLTSAIRRQPFTVLLLDEVEKAHPDVFDLLLQVLGEGRLTDAGGQTADFCNAIIVLTSNLGSQEQRSQVGFGAKKTGDAGIYTKAAENFFRPEFFNRLDRVIPFHVLERHHIAGMAERLARRALDRFGLRQRKLLLDLKPEVFEMLADRGFEVEYGARALRRSVEDNLVQPLAEILTQIPTAGLSTIEVGVGADGKLTVNSSSFVAPPRLPRRRLIVAKDIAELSDRLNVLLKRIGDELDDWDKSDDYSVQSHYFFLREELLHLRRWREQLLHSAEVELNPQNANLTQRASRFGRKSTRLFVRDFDPAATLEELNESGDPGSILATLADEAEVLPTLSHHAENLIQRANKLEYFVAHRDEQTAPHSIVFGGNHPLLREYDGDPHYEVDHSRAAYIFTSYFETFDSLPSGEAEWRERTNKPGSSCYDLIIDLPLIDRFLDLERGTQLIYTKDAHTFDVTLGFTDKIDSPHEALANAGTADQEVLRVHHENGYTLDLRTGIITGSAETSLWNFINPHLPTAPEFVDF